MREIDRQLLCQHYLDLYQIAYGLLQDETEVEDAVQEALAVTMSKAIVRDPLKYCKMVLRNYCMDRLKYLNRLTIGVKEQAETNESIDEKKLIALWKLKEQLPQSESRMLDLHFKDGYTMAEISDMTGMSVALVKKKFAQTYEQLRNQLEKQK